MSAYISVNIERCQRDSHKMKLTWSDKTPLKASLLCDTCSRNSGKSAYAAYGDDTKSFGAWKARRGIESLTSDPGEENGG